MPATLAELHRAVQSTLGSKRLGVPVFVRYQLCNQERAQVVPDRLAQIAGTVRGWLGQEIERVYALGSVKAGQVTLSLEFRGGATALVSWARSQAQGGGVDLMILGNRGAIYHDAGTSALWDEPAAPPADAPDRVLLALVQRALRTGRPEGVRAGDD
jgi:hypothetical protein